MAPGQVFFANFAGGEKTIGRVTTGANIACWTIAGDQVEQPRCSAGAALQTK